MESNYDISQWEKETDIGRRLFIHNFGMTGSEFPGWKLFKAVVMPHGAGVEEKIYMWEPKKGDKDQRLRVSVIESGYWRHTHQHLVDQLRHCMHGDMPRGTAKTAGIGDVQYIGQAEETKVTTSVFFTRGNLRISIHSVGKTPVDVTSMAIKLDNRLVKPPSETEKKKGTVMVKKPLTLKMKKAEKAALIDSLPAPEPGAGMTRVLMDDGELRRDGDVLYCISEKEGSKKAQILNFKLA